ncbi:MAG: Large-conductance mechanosensitive channel [Parcubacteria group bacterium GW2011_GWF2_44_8]|nr:MAG: Large-conductance mechanosensitive channel [Parcubacteria group bacterium GW2011_GWF2_44_8]
MKNFVKEFKAFAMRGNVVDLAVAVVIGAAFGKIVSSLVENIVTPLIGVLLGGVDFSGLSFTIGESIIKYGVFLQSIFDFMVIAFAIFMVIKALSRLKNKEEIVVDEPPKPIPEDIVLLREIRDELRGR